MSTQPNGFLDYYQILQIHHAAQPEIVKSAYRRLAQLYHPDRNNEPDAAARMQTINEAYAVISDPARRRGYHRTWEHAQRRSAPRTAPPRAKTANTAKKPATPPGQTVLDRYFRCLLDGQWKEAYALLTEQDRRNVSLSDFRSWKEAVDALYQMGSYVIRPFRMYKNVLVARQEYEKVQSFSVFLTDRDRRSRRISEETCTKYVACENGSWRVCLGYVSLKPIILRLRLLAEQGADADPVRIAAETLLRKDQLTGLFSRKGLMEVLEKETARTRRFGNPMALLLLSVQPSGRIHGMEPEAYVRLCVAHVAKQLAPALRITDHAARTATRTVAVLLIETDAAEARRAQRRLTDKLCPGDSLEYTIRSSVTAYRMDGAEDFLLRAEHEAHAQILVGRGGRRQVRIHMDDRPI